MQSRIWMVYLAMTFALVGLATQPALGEPAAPPPAATQVRTAGAATPTPVTAQAAALRSANVRAGPGTQYAVIGGLKPKEAVTLIGRNNKQTWLLVRTAQLEGWVLASLLKTGKTTGLPVRTSTAPTVTPAARATTAAAEGPPVAGPVACGASVPAPANLQEGVRPVGNIPGWGTVSVTEWTWTWDGLPQVQGIYWYFDLQLLHSDQPGAPVIATVPIFGGIPGLGQMPAHQGNVWSASDYQVRDIFQKACPGGQQCPLFMRVQVAMRDAAGQFQCFVSGPSNLVRIW